MRKLNFLAAAALAAALWYSPMSLSAADKGKHAARSHENHEDNARTVRVRAAQTKLKTMGHYEGAVDGVWGPSTEAAVRQYQQQNDIKVTGKLDKRTAEKLDIEWNVNARADRRSRDGKAERVGRKAGGAVGEAADESADAVTDAGEASGKGIRKAGKETSKAGDPVDKGFDKAGNAAGSGVETGLDKAGDGVEAAIEGTGKGLKAAGNAVKDVFDGDDPDAKVTTRETYDTRQTTSMTREAQTKLKDQGYYVGAVDGIMGPDTEEALRKYQHDKDLPATGKLDTDTIDKLDLND